VVYTFRPHPVKVLYPDRPLPLLTTYEERAHLIESLGVDVLIAAPFDRDFAKMEASRFVREVLVEGIGAAEVLVGYDYAFGRGREGNPEFLRRMSRELGFRLEIIPPVRLDGVVVSSSRIRRAVQEGDLRLANRMLGREFSVEGRVLHGHGRGKELGYPTANLAVERELLPKPGVYAVRVFLPDEETPRGGMANLGTNPTFGDGVLSLEVHIFDHRGSLYGKRLRLTFVERLRDEVRFSSPEALVEQLKKDEAFSRKLLGRETPSR